MKKLLLSAAALTILLGACKKKEDGGGNNNSWNVAGTGYSATTVQMLSTQLGAVSASPVGSFTASFDAVPTASGAYKISDMSSVSANSVHIGVSHNSKTYMSMGYEGNANVSVNGGKVSISVPEIWLKNASTPTTDSVKFSGSMTQP